MQIASPPTRLQAIAGGPSFPTLEGCELLASLKLAAVTTSTPSALASLSTGLSQSGFPLALPARIADRHFGRSENTPIHQKTKDKRDFISTVFWLGSKLLPAVQIANLSLAPAISNRNIKPGVAVRNSHENHAHAPSANSKFQFSIFRFLQVQRVPSQESCLRS
jgi:hypothetical protein